MREDEVYVSAKVWFRNNGFAAIAGQPPSGCDNIPTVEIKDLTNREKGSKGSFKPDLIVANIENLIIVECKPLDNSEDEQKLLEVDRSVDRLSQLYKELGQRGIFARRRLHDAYSNFTDFVTKARYCLAHGGIPRPMDRVITLSLSSIDGEGQLFQPMNERYRIRV
jgi:hypothetical protein